MDGISPRDGQQRGLWIAAPVLVGSGIVAALAVGKVAIAAPLWQAELGLDLARIGWLTALFSMIGLFGGIPAGALAARFGDRRILLFGLRMAAVGAAIGAVASNYGLLLASRVVEGLGFLMIVVSAPALLQRVVPPAERDRAMALWSCFMPAGIALAMLTAPLLSGWRAYWWVNVTLALLLAIAVMRVIPRAAVAAPSPGRGLRDDSLAVLRAPGPMLLAASFGLYALMFFAMMNFLPILLMQRMGVSLGMAGLMSAATSAVNIVGILAAGFLLSRGVGRGILIGAASLAMGAVGLAVFLPVLPDAGTFAACVAFSAIAGIVPATLFATIPLVTPAPQLTPVALGLLMQGSNLGQAVGPVAVGGAVDAFGWSAAASIVAATGLAAAALAMAIGRIVAHRR